MRRPKTNENRGRAVRLPPQHDFNSGANRNAASVLLTLRCEVGKNSCRIEQVADERSIRLNRLSASSYGNPKKERNQ